MFDWGTYHSVIVKQTDQLILKKYLIIKILSQNWKGDCILEENLPCSTGKTLEINCCPLFLGECGSLALWLRDLLLSLSLYIYIYIYIYYDS